MTTPGARTPAPLPPVRPEISPRSWSREPRHQFRRRRAVALAGVVLVAVVVAILLAGGNGVLRAPSPGHGQAGFFRQVQTLAGAGTRSLAARELVAQNAAIDRTLAYTPYVRIAGSQHREVALTFDDGPGPYTPEILAVLGQEDVPATFFEVGVEEHFFHAATSQIVADGYPIGDHTFSHSDMAHLTRAQQRAQLLNQIRVIRNYGASYPRLFRPPYGMWNPTTMSLLHRYRMLMILWTVDTNDYRLPGVPAIVRAAVKGAKPGAIILLHDAGGDRSETVQALPTIISALRDRGYRLVTVPQLLVDNPAPADQQISAVLGSGG